MKHCSDGFCIEETLFSILIFLVLAGAFSVLEVSVVKNGYSGLSHLVDECRNLRLDCSLRSRISNMRILYYEDENEAVEKLKEKIEKEMEDSGARLVFIQSRYSNCNRICGLNVTYEFAGRQKKFSENFASGY